MPTLFSNSAHFAEHYPALESVDFARISPSIELVELQYLRDHVLGATLYDNLLAAYQASITTSPTAMSTAMANLHARCVKPVAHLAAYEAMPDLNVLFTSGGMMVQVGEGQQSAPMWRVHQARKSALKKGYAFLDQLVAFLAANEATYPEWVEAPLRAEVRESLIPTAVTTERYLRVVNGSWLLYKLRPALRKAQQGPIRTLLGSALDTLVAHVHANPSAVTPDEALILEEARPAMLYLAIVEMAIPLGINTDESGVWSWQSTTSGGQASGGEQQVSAEWMNAKLRNYEKQAAIHLENLRALVQPTTAPATRLPDISGGFMMS